MGSQVNTKQRLIATFKKPEYFFQPKRLAGRFKSILAPASEISKTQSIDLLWGCSLNSPTHDVMGDALRTFGLYDLVVSEVLFRLTEPGAHVLDIGANIGYMSSLLAFKAGPSGRVGAFEPHPKLAEQLRHNCQLWSIKETDFAQIKITQCALSDTDGTTTLYVPSEFTGNCGTATLNSSHPMTTADKIKISVRSLDQLSPSYATTTLWKIDTEGTEAQVLKGALGLLSLKTVRDIVFEEHLPYPTEATSILENAGYTLFWLHKQFFGPNLVPIAYKCPPPVWEAQSVLATLDPDRALSLTQKRGWQILNLPAQSTHSRSLS